jgi:hypothetical protein
MIELKQSTARYINIGPFLDVGDAATNETGLAGSMTVYLSKAGGARSARNSATAISYDRDGCYRIHLDATDTGTLGDLVVSISDPTTHLHVEREFSVVTANYYDSKYSTDLFQVDIQQCAGSSVAGVADFKATGFSTFNAGSDTVTLTAATHTGAVIPTVTDVTNGLTPGNVTVGGYTAAALLELLQTDTGETSASAGSVAKLAQGASGLDSATVTTACETAIDNKGLSGNGIGAETVTITIDDGSDPLDGAEVWVTTDSIGTNRVASGISNASGQVTFMLDTGSYYVWKQLAGYNFTNPSALTVT